MGYEFVNGIHRPAFTLQVLKNWGGKFSTNVVTLARGESIAQGILKVAKEDEVDFIVMGIAGNDEKLIGSVTSGVAQEARCITFAVKNPYVVSKNRLLGAQSTFDAAVPRELQTKLSLRQ
jgi:hypothetical protein